MRVLETASATVVVLGEGQIGTAIVEQLGRRGARASIAGRSDWSTPTSSAVSTIAALGSAGPRSNEPVVVVWAAGAAGMGSTAEYCERSLDTMRAVVQSLVGSRWKPSALHVVGSAGAMAVGSPRWHPEAERPPSPVAPYVELKRAEEELASRLPDCRAVIHRVSSVYGPPGRPGRMGMVTTLIRNAVQNRPTSIVGTWSTLRNYVHADDVATSIVDDVLRPSAVGLRVLAAPRSHSIGELVGLVASARRRPVPIRLLPATNADHLTIDPNAVSSGFRCRPLAIAVRQMVLELRRTYTPQLTDGG